MKSILTALMILGAFYLSSCTKNDTPINVPVVLPKSDSVSKMGFFQISFAGKSFYVNDLVVQNSPVYSFSASTLSYDYNDTLWINLLQMTDHKSKTFGVNLTTYNNTSGADIGTYLVRTNNSTVTDYSEGKNKVYAVGVGSSVTITHTNYTTEGSFALTLYYNYQSIPATGSFKIFN